MTLRPQTPGGRGPGGSAASAVLVLVDLQLDFLPGGALAVPGGDEVLDLANALATRFRNVVLSQDWHPAGHVSFALTHAGRAPFERIELDYGPQILWPDHCIQDSPGAAIAPQVRVPHAQLVVRKGHHAGIDSYSTFFEADRATPTGLAGYLRERGIDTVYLAGLALDFCVSWSAVDAARHGFTTLVVEDACRAINVDGSLTAALADMEAAGVTRTTASELLG
ncbi:bifunctional nicotinamidase/pyrazinamidase [Xanthobacter sp. KR7-65]|uniref:bifunctional nicotinamidase/pyrazinamidase n=1 Tax=Xanthobacter sp. KR7-65 TaxID=3156612 RepID=UPI0032B3E60A